MKFKNSSIPYLFLLFGFLIVLPLLDAKVEDELLLDYKVQPCQFDNYVINQHDNSNNWKTQVALITN